MENSSLRFCVTSPLYRALFFFSTSSLGFTFGCRRNQMILKQTNKQDCISSRIQFCTPKPACSSGQDISGTYTRGNDNQGVCKTHVRGQWEHSVLLCRESALPSEMGLCCSCCTLGTEEAAVDRRGAVRLGKEHRPDGLCSQAASLEEWIEATSVSGMLVGCVGWVSVDSGERTKKTDKSNGHLTQSVRLMGIKASYWTEHFKTRSSAF